MENTRKNSARKHHQIKNKQPLKVVYITNPMKFKTSASEFRALVQELTGKDAHTPPDSATYAVDGGGVGGGVEAAEGNVVHAVEEEEKIEFPSIDGEVEQEGSDPLTSGSYFVDDFFCQEMMDINYQLGLVGSKLVDVHK